MAKLTTEAKKELKSIVKDTKKAADKIFKAVSKGQKALEKVENPTVRKKLEDSFNLIIENCYFQDFCGQRSNKVIGYIEEIEKSGSKGDVKSKKGYKKLLNGPSKGGVSQSEIDKLFD